MSNVVPFPRDALRVAELNLDAIASEMTNARQSAEHARALAAECKRIERELTKQEARNGQTL